MFGTSKPPSLGFALPAATTESARKAEDTTAATTKSSLPDSSSTPSSAPFAAGFGTSKTSSSAAPPSGGFAFTKPAASSSTPFGAATGAAASTTGGFGSGFGSGFGAGATNAASGPQKGFGSSTLASSSARPPSSSPPSAALRTPPPPPTAGSGRFDDKAAASQSVVRGAEPSGAIGRSVEVRPGEVGAALARLAGPGVTVQTRAPPSSSSSSSPAAFTTTAPVASAVPQPRRIPSGPILRGDTGEVDVNAAILSRHGALHRLTRAVDAVVARHYVTQQKQKMLDDLESVVDRLEAESARTAKERARVQEGCQLLQGQLGPHPRHARAAVGEDMELLAAYRANGDAMLTLYKKHLVRLDALIEQLHRLSVSTDE